MKKLIAMLMVAVMLCAALAALAALAEEGQLAPLYATVGEAMDDSVDGRVIAGGVHDDYFAVVTQKDGRYYRSVANYDAQLTQLEQALDELDYEAEDFFEKHEAAMNAVDEYLKTLPIAYSEEFTAQPLTGDAMAAMTGKTLAQLTEEGFEIGSNGTEPDGNDDMIIVYTLRFGVYDYNCTVDADFDSYIAAQDAGTEDELVVKDVALLGITEWSYDKRFHTDGTVDEPEDPFAAYGEIMTRIVQLLQKEQAGEAVDMEGLAEELKAEYPDSADMVDFYVELYRASGAEGLVAMLTTAEEE